MKKKLRPLQVWNDSISRFRLLTSRLEIMLSSKKAKRLSQAEAFEKILEIAEKELDEKEREV